MQRDVALRLDGIVSGIRTQLDWLANAAKMNLDDEEYKVIARQIGEAMGAIYEISNQLYSQYPDILPDELKPPPSPA
jgi:hypothetical protein